MADRGAPQAHLKLEWVYGYRGHQCRSNIKYTINGNIVYYVAGVGIVYNTKDHKQSFFLGHDDDIVSLALHPEKSLVATGQVGKEPYICVWDSTSLKTISILKGGHHQGVGAVAFSQTGSRLASVGLDTNSTMNVWDWQKGNIISTVRAHSDRVFDCQFRPNDPNQLVTCGVKHIKFWTLSGNTLTARKGIFGKTGEIQTMLCLTFGPDATTYAGTLTGNVYVWSGNQLERVIQAAHVGAIYSMEGGEEGYVTGGKDGCVNLFDCAFQQLSTINLVETTVGHPGLVVRSVLWHGEQVLIGTQDSEVFEVNLRDRERPVRITTGHAEGELWALAVHPKKPIFATASDDQTLRMFHMPDHELLARTTSEQKIRSCAFNEDGSMIAYGCMDGSFVVLKSKDLSEIVHLKERKEVIHEMKFSPDGKVLAVGSNDNFVDLYDVAQRFKKVGECRGNSSFITHLDWSEDSRFLQTNSGAGERLVFRAPTGKQVVQAEEIRTIRWASWTGVLGPEVTGIWEKYTDTNDVNAVDANFGTQLVATGDDFGLVKLFRFPTLKKGAKFRKYVGHSAHVTNVRWSHDGTRLISTGGGDHATFQWRLIKDGLGADGDGGALPDDSGAYTDSNDEASDSDLSDVAPVNSDVERECQKNYKRSVYREDQKALEQTRRTEITAGQKRKKAPSQGLILEFVHGYRGYDCRNNLFYLQTGEIVYHVAAAGIVHNTSAHTQRFYTQHTDDILCLALHPEKDFVATGQVGREPTIHVWDAESMKTLSILKGHHERGICALDFSGDGRKLASVGLDDNHTIVAWDWRKGEKLATTRGNKDKIFVIKFNPFDPDRLVTVGIKFIRFWTQAGAGFTSQRGTFGTVAKLDTLLCAAYGSTPDVCYTGGATGTIYVWRGNILERVVQAHEGGCFAMHSLDKGFVTGGRDGTVCLFDETFTKTYKTFTVRKNALATGSRGSLISDCPPIRAAVLGHGHILVGTRNGEVIEIDREGPMRVLVQGHTEGEIWGLAVHPTQPVCATVSDDRSLRVWEVKPGDHRMINARQLKGPARCLDLSFDGKHVAVGFRDGSFTVMKMDTLEDVCSFHDRKEEISDIKFSPNPGKYLGVASHDNFVDIYNVISQKRVGVCKAASSYVTHVDWDMQGKLLMLNSGAREQLFFEAPRGTRQTPSRSEIETMAWYSWTCVLGDTCVGIWPPKCDVTDVNAASLTSDRALLATADDFGYVKLFDYPVKTKFAKYKQYVGHSAHVTNVRWLRDDSYLISIGGADTAIMVWRHRYDTSAAAALHNGAASAAVLNGKAASSAAGGASDLSDTDSEEEGGYDSDVQREKNMNYAEKTYAAGLKERQGLKPSLQPRQEAEDDPLRQTVSRQAPKPPKLQQTPSSTSPTDTKAGGRSGSRKGAGRSAGNGPLVNPVRELELVHIYGYRGFDTRNNLHYLDDDGAVIVYHAAGAGIVHDLASGQQQFYVSHTDDILCLAVNRYHKFRNVVATGQLGDTPPIHIWNASTCQALSILQGPHTDGVCALDFSCSGKFLLSVGIDEQHTVAIWRWQEGSLVATSPGNRQRILNAEFRPDSDSNFVTVGVKHVKFWTIAGGQLVAKRGILAAVPGGQNPSKMTTMLSIAFGTDNVTFTGAMSGDVWVWKDNILQRLILKVHNGPVFALYTTLRDGLILSGGKEKGKDTGSLKLWDQEMRRCRPLYLRSGGPDAVSSDPPDVVKSVCRGKGRILVGTKGGEVIEIQEKSGALNPLVRGHGEGELWGLATHPNQSRFATASDDGTVRIWDATTKAMLHKLVTGPARSVHYSTSGDLIAVGLKNGGFLVLAATTCKLLAKRRDRGASVADLRFSPDGRWLAVGCEEPCVDLYEVTGPGASGDGAIQVEKQACCKGINSPVIQMDFAADSKHIRVSTSAYVHCVFSVPSGEPVTDKVTLDSITWASWTSVLGEEVLGIWPADADKADVNCAQVSHGNNALVTGDDYGLVKLFNFPCPEPNAPHQTYVGHSAHVTNARFLSDDSHLVTTGGDDCCIFVWKCK